jgi:hypothetical protein
MAYLELSKMLGTLVHLHSLEPNTNCSRGDNDNSVAILSELEGSVHDQGKNGQERFVCVFIHDGACAYDIYQQEASTKAANNSCSKLCCCRGNTGGSLLLQRRDTYPV